MLTDFYIKQGDTLEPFTTVLKYGDGTLLTRDLTGAEIRVHMKQGGGTALLVDALGTLINNTAKRVGYQWVAGDTDVASTTASPHQLEVQVTYADGNVETFPNTRNVNVHVFQQIA